MGRLPCYSNYAVHKHWNWYLLQIQWRTSENYGGMQLSIAAFFLKMFFQKLIFLLLRYNTVMFYRSTLLQVDQWELYLLPLL